MSVITTEYGQIVKEPTVTDFHNDAYKTESEGFLDSIVKHDRYGVCVVLSNTLFYAHGGGQKGDRGLIQIEPVIASKVGLPPILAITDTRKEDGLILHVLGGINQEKLDFEQIHTHLLGGKVAFKINWEFRYKQMRLHAIAHLLHFVTEDVSQKSDLPYPETSDLQDGFGINRYSIPNIVGADGAETIREELMAYNRQGIGISTYADKNKAGFRYWKCGEYLVPCGGTHLSSTEEIGDFTLRTKTKKGKTSLTFELN